MTTRSAMLACAVWQACAWPGLSAPRLDGGGGERARVRTCAAVEAGLGLRPIGALHGHVSKTRTLIQEPTLATAGLLEQPIYFGPGRRSSAMQLRQHTEWPFESCKSRMHACTHARTHVRSHRCSHARKRTRAYIVVSTMTTWHRFWITKNRPFKNNTAFVKRPFVPVVTANGDGAMFPDPI